VKRAAIPDDGTTVRTTQYDYDQVGNRTKVITPRGVDTANPDDFTRRTDYDELNRPVKAYQPYDPADPEHSSAEVYTRTVYDEAGRVAKTSLPPGVGESERIDTSYTYYDNGWTKGSTDPQNIKTGYDYDDDGHQTKRTMTGDDGTSSRTMAWSYYADGSLETRTAPPRACLRTSPSPTSTTSTATSARSTSPSTARRRPASTS
jgi:YD repeat-containing protein